MLSNRQTKIQCRKPLDSVNGHKGPFTYYKQNFLQRLIFQSIGFDSATDGAHGQKFDIDSGVFVKKMINLYILHCTDMIDDTTVVIVFYYVLN